MMKFTTFLAASAAALTTIAASTAVVHADDNTASTGTDATVHVKADAAFDNKLILQTAPDFLFPDAKVKEIYDKYDHEVTGSNKDLVIIDTRTADRTEGWQLDTAITAFHDGDDVLNKATVTLSTATTPAFTFNEKEMTTGTVALPGEAIHLATSLTDRGTLTLPAKDIKAHLVQTGTPSAKAKDGSQYQAILTWTLTPTIKTAAAL
jgi:hypothetical protein